MTDEPNGRALAEAAARAMGWRQGSECWLDGWTKRDLEKSPPTERELLAWLHERGNVEANTSKSVAQVWHHGRTTNCRYGDTLRDALMRLVVVVAEREAANG